MTRLIQTLRSQAIGVLALFIALAGTGYAAISIPAGSVGARQIKNHSITPVKLDPRFINANVRAWAVVAPDGRVEAGTGEPTVYIVKVRAGSYIVTWHKVPAPLFRRCFAISGLTGESSLGDVAGSVEASVDPSAGHAHHGDVGVATFDAQGSFFAQGFSVALVC